MRKRRSFLWHRFIAVFSIFVVFCGEALAQAGSWSFLSPALEGGDMPARWRRVYFRPNVPPGSGMTTDYDVAPPYSTRPLFYDMAESQTYGIHAAVTPQTWQASGQTVPRGSVLLWGVGVSPTWGPGNVQPNYTPLLLWSGDSIFETARRRYGYVTFCPDPNPLITDFLNDGNIFCSGHVNLPDGKLFVAGGQQKDTDNSIHGIQAAFAWTAAGWASGTSYGWSGILGGPGNGYPGVGMIEKRWYPTPTVLPSGQVQIVGGLQTTNPSNETKTFETYDPVQNRFQFTNLPPRQIEHLGNEYPRILLVSVPKPDGCAVARSVYVGPYPTLYSRSVDSPTSPWEAAPSVSGLEFRGRGTAVLLPSLIDNPLNAAEQALRHVLLIGGSDGATMIKRRQILEFGLTPDEFKTTATMIADWDDGESGRRRQLSATLLPTGQVFVCGGTKVWESSSEWRINLSAEDHTVTETRALAPHGSNWASATFDVWASVDVQDRDADDPNRDKGGKVKDGARIYHSTSVLLPDARVLAAGTDMSAGNWNLNDPNLPAKVVNRFPSLFSPPYLDSQGTRPQIAGTGEFGQVGYAEAFLVDYTLAPSRTIKHIALMRPGSATHAFDFEQRLVKLFFSHVDSDTVAVVAPFAPEIAPPGYYMLFIVDSANQPSKAGWVQIGFGEIAPECGAQELSLMSGGDEGYFDLIGEEKFEPLTVDWLDRATGLRVARYRPGAGKVGRDGRAALQWAPNLPPGEYDLIVRPYKTFLSKRVSLSWPARGVIGALVNGDLNGDNRIDSEDLRLVDASFGAIGAGLAHDLNKDGIVDELDRQIVERNMGARGDE